MYVRVLGFLPPYPDSLFFWKKDSNELMYSFNNERAALTYRISPAKWNQVKYVTLYNLFISLILLEINWSFRVLKKMNSFLLNYLKALLSQDQFSDEKKIFIQNSDFSIELEK